MPVVMQATAPAPGETLMRIAATKKASQVPRVIVSGFDDRPARCRAKDRPDSSRVARLPTPGTSDKLRAHDRRLFPVCAAAVCCRAARRPRYGRMARALGLCDLG